MQSRVAAAMLNGRSVLWATVIFIALVAFLWYVPQLHSYQNVPPGEVPALMNEYRRTWAQIIGGFALLVGLYATLRRVEIAERTLEATQDQQVTERFTRAIDQLGATDDAGNPRLEIRLGGIYALERIARDSPERDYSTVMEVLTAYVRENAPWSPTRIETIEETDEWESAERRAMPPSQSPRADIQAVLDVLGRREEYRVPVDRRVRLKLSRTDLRTTNLVSAPLKNASLVDAHLEYATLANSCLESANLMDAHLEGAFLSAATGLTQEQIDVAHGDETTKLPEGLERPAHWSKSSDEQPNGKE